MKKFDLIVVGAGPGGYVAAIRAAQRGLKVACVEKHALGGTCLNVGCIPSKALLHSTEYYDKILSEGKEHGIEIQGLKINLETMMKRKEKIVANLIHGIHFLFKKYQVDQLIGKASLLSPNSLSVNGQSYSSQHILLATGSEPIPMDSLPFDQRHIFSSTDLLSFSHIPKKLLIVGGGIIGLELGSIYQRMGTEIEVVELFDRLTPFFDYEISEILLKMFSKRGMVFHFKEKVIRGNIEGNTVELLLESNKRLKGEGVLFAIGRRPYTKGLGLEKVGIQTDPKGRIPVDGSFRTSIPTIYAIGDLINGPMLAHKASEEGMAVVDLICGDKVKIDYMTIPNIMYTWPEVASVGMTEEAARQSGLSLRIGKIPFQMIPRARCSGDTEGIVKLIGEKKNDRLIGMQIMGPNASEMIHEGVIAIKKEMTLLEIARISHAHPTCSEAIKEAAMLAHHQAIHL
ncbi:MAG: dihydrolipoyl dehydrogenase [Chlamydiales bacterium]